MDSIPHEEAGTCLYRLESINSYFRDRAGKEYRIFHLRIPLELAAVIKRASSEKYSHPLWHTWIKSNISMKSANVSQMIISDLCITPIRELCV